MVPRALQPFVAVVDILLLPLLLLEALVIRVFSWRKTRCRLFFGTMHINHLPALAAALRRRGADVAVVVWNPPPHEVGHVPYDVVVASRVGRLFRFLPVRYLVQFALFAWVIARYDVCVMPFRNRLMDRSVIARWTELPLLRLAGVKVVLNSYGADIMAPRTVFADRRGFNVASGYLADPRYSNINEREVIRNTRHGERWADLIVCSMDHFDYLRRVDAAVHLRGVDPERYSPVFVSQNETPVVVHAPNHRALKGTEYLIAAVERLRSDGFECELRIIEGQPHSTVLHEVREADIVADQFIIGAYGRFAIEGMMLGKPVLCYLREELFEHNPHWRDAPILNADPLSIEQALRSVLSMTSAERAEIGRRSREFAILMHSANAVADKLLILFEQRLGQKVPLCTRRKAM